MRSGARGATEQGRQIGSHRADRVAALHRDTRRPTQAPPIGRGPLCDTVTGEPKGRPCLVSTFASFGFGFEVNFLGLPLHWDFARQWNFQRTITGFKTAFYIGPTF